METSQRDPPGRVGERVLYVDDEPTLIFLTTRILERLGYQIAGYSDPLEALREFRSRPDDFDVVVTDLSMPTLSGFDLARALLAIRPDVPIVATSGYLRTEDQKEGEELGLRALILKPNTAEGLAEFLDQLFCDRRAAAGRAREGET